MYMPFKYIWKDKYSRYLNSQLVYTDITNATKYQ